MSNSATTPMGRAAVARKLAVVNRGAQNSLPAKGWLRRITMHPHLKPYNRLALLAVLVNAWAFSRLGIDFAAPAAQIAGKLAGAADLALINFTVALLIRQQYVVNLLWAVAMRVPKSWPLSIRWAAGKVYHYGGIHVGAFFSGTVWLALYATSLWLAGGVRQAPGLFSLLTVHVGVLTTMSIMALPIVRHADHDAFEIIGRFGGWLSLLMFWLQLLAFDGRDLSDFRVWLLALVTFSVALPWMRLRKVKIDMTRPSSHVALARFDYGVTPFAGSSTDLSRSPLLEWHAFANVPSPGASGFRLTISRAGDWTGALIDDMPKHIWVRGIPTAGVGHVELLFRKVVWLATGSGIGPCLPHLLQGKVPAKLIWSTRSPRATYGDELVDEILAAQPDALIWDTKARGKPDLAALALRAVQEFGAEAVIVISNRPTTFQVNYELESRGIPAFGAIWDS